MSGFLRVVGLGAIVLTSAGAALWLTRTGPADIEQRLLRIAQEYATWPRVSDRANWAPTDCIIRPPAGVLASESSDDATHGHKLYHLFARDGQSYEWLGGGSDSTNRQSPVGQVLVKEAWTPIPVDSSSATSFDSAEVTSDGRYRTGERAGLFVMLKLDPRTPGTDQGWVYATLDATGKRVRTVGLVGSCMNCHAAAPYDRLFGLPYARAAQARP